MTTRRLRACEREMRKEARKAWRKKRKTNKIEPDNDRIIEREPEKATRIRAKHSKQQSKAAKRLDEKPNQHSAFGSPSYNILPSLLLFLLLLITRIELRHIRDDDERSCEDTFVSRLRLIDSIMTQNQIERARHRTGRNLTRIFLGKERTRSRHRKTKRNRRGRMDKRKKISGQELRHRTCRNLTRIHRNPQHDRNGKERADFQKREREPLSQAV